MRYALLFLLLLSFLAASQELPRIEVREGDTLRLPIPLTKNHTTGERLIGADFVEVRIATPGNATAMIRNIFLYDDGKDEHVDEKAGDGIYSGEIRSVDILPGVYQLFYYTSFNGAVTFSGAQYLSIGKKWLIFAKEDEPILGSALAIITAAVVLFLVNRRRLSASLRLRELETKRESINKAIEQAQNDFFLRKISEETLTKTVYDYKQQLINIDLELEKSRAKKTEEKKEEEKKG